MNGSLVAQGVFSDKKAKWQMVMFLSQKYNFPSISFIYKKQICKKKKKAQLFGLVIPEYRVFQN